MARSTSESVQQFSLVALYSLFMGALFDKLLFEGKATKKLKRLIFRSPLKRFGTDLTVLAKLGKLDMVIGRDEEIKQLINILLKRRKSNACLVGEAGVGKTAIVEALAIKIAAKSAPPQLKGKKVISLDINRMFSGTIYRGMLEERLDDLLDEVKESKGSIILFIDELHTLIKNDRQIGDIASVLKPALARNNFMCIGATTMEEYTRYIERDGALKRRFQPIRVDEPSRDESIKMLNGLIQTYQTHHGVTYSETALLAAVDLSKLYIRESQLPDKAIDLIDKAGALAQVLEKKFVSDEDIEHTVSMCTGIPVTRISTKESQRLLNIEDTMKRSLVGQDEAVKAVCRSILRARVGVRDETKPIGCFLFTGPTGVGKTEMAKVLAREYFGSEEAMVRLDMSEFMEYHTVSRLIGSAPGYHSHYDGGQLTEAVRRRPHNLVLFDEIEKAHDKVLNLLLQILDDGRLTDGKGKTVDFSNTIVILTSNVGSSLSEMMGVFRAELLNRFDQIVVFKPLEKEHIENILEIMIEKFCARAFAKKKIEVEVSEKLKERLILEGYNMRYGARALKRAVTSLVEDKFAEEILNGSAAQHDTIIMDVAPTGEVVCRVVSPAVTNLAQGAPSDEVQVRSANEDVEEELSLAQRRTSDHAYLLGCLSCISAICFAYAIISDLH